jgi:hypothetical protein
VGGYKNRTPILSYYLLDIPAEDSGQDFPLDPRHAGVGIIEIAHSVAIDDERKLIFVADYRFSLSRQVSAKLPAAQLCLSITMAFRVRFILFFQLINLDRCFSYIHGCRVTRSYPTLGCARREIGV